MRIFSPVSRNGSRFCFFGDQAYGLSKLTRLKRKATNMRNLDIHSDQFMVIFMNFWKFIFDEPVSLTNTFTYRGTASHMSRVGYEIPPRWILISGKNIESSFYPKESYLCSALQFMNPKSNVISVRLVYDERWISYKQFACNPVI